MSRSAPISGELLPPGPQPKLTLRHKKTREAAVHLFTRGLSQRQVATALGIDEHSIRSYRTHHPDFDQECRAGAEARLKRLREKAVDCVEMHLDNVLAGEETVKPAIIRALFAPSEARVVDAPPPDEGAETLKLMNEARERMRARINQVLDK